jgi:hypothetical protein
MRLVIALQRTQGARHLEWRGRQPDRTLLRRNGGREQQATPAEISHAAEYSRSAPDPV